MLGEGPGLSEDLTGVAFNGPSGRLLDQMIEDACRLGIIPLPQPSIYITNIVLCHPTNSFAGDNRPPTKEEVFSCAVNVMGIYQAVSPRLVVFVGKLARHYYGTEFTESIEIHHPSYLLRTGGAASRYYMHNVRILHDAFEDLTEELDNEEKLPTKGAGEV
jgi:uracil-DNA glycosylase